MTRLLQYARKRALITPAVQESIGIRAIQTVNYVGLVDRGQGTGTSAELLESHIITSPEFAVSGHRNC